MALMGMTGFARTEGALGAWTWAVEARSVNGRNLDVKLRWPPGFEGLERVAREAAQARFQRGQVTIGVQAKRAESAGAVKINEDTLALFAARAQRLWESGSAVQARADGLLALKGVIEASDDTDDAETKATVEKAMAKSIEQAFEGLKASRLGEGAALTPILSGAIDRIAALVAQAEGEAAAQPAYVRERFEKRLAELVTERSANLEERIVQEAAVLAAKADVREELDRLTAHVDAARALMASDQGAGRRLDFLTQEFMREANTLCSKSATTTLTTIGLELKAVIEQFREQVQNVE
jgi:uncharacterized protein (TIGR00255 family)